MYKVVTGIIQYEYSQRIYLRSVSVSRGLICCLIDIRSALSPSVMMVKLIQFSLVRKFGVAESRFPGRCTGHLHIVSGI